ncbi:hypothetical protein [Candidatus Uabimicrobium sp. HlEnr_7]|uniref:hypothetical protein n=1 Tax=Candidatus Uabimicrobium helgolandensis TaxID=3095367 RepID=UPI0035584B80
MNKKIAITTTILLFIINTFVWIIPSNVIRMIAIKKTVLLGHYSVARLTGNIAIFAVSIIILYIVWANTRKMFKKRCFRVCAVLLALIPTIVLLDFSLRLLSSKRYVGNNQNYHRPPNYTYSGIYKDIPLQKKSYSRIEKGYPEFPYTMTIDNKGFRNSNNLKHCDIVLVGDSFTEGPEVSDNQVWGKLLEKKVGKVLCNLGMAGSDPLNYLITFEKYALELKPKIAICTIYEGNDFRRTQIFSDHKETISLSKRMKLIFKTSPIRNYIKSFLIAYTETNTGKTSSNAIDWLPLEYPANSKVYHSFPVKRIMQHYVPYEKLQNSSAWKNVQSALTKIQDLCNKKNIRLILIFAPTKPHVVLPVMQKEISKTDFHDFCMLYKRKMRKKLSDNDFFEKVLQRLKYKEQLIRDFCDKNKIEFVSLTNILQKKVKVGEQMYFTYDQHWTPLGHVVVANFIYQYLQSK